MRSGDDPDEIFDLVDMDDRVIGRARRGDAHHNPSLIHRSVQVVVFTSNGRVLLQKRAATKDLFPGYLCASASGHVMTGDGYVETARRELAEELGVNPAILYLDKAVVRSEMETEITALFLARCDGPFTFSPTETDGGIFLALDDALALRSDPEAQTTPALRVALDEIARSEADGRLRAALEAL
ncbi:MAG TPA: NUDIX domain-containing protein [Ktedonobacterales bacterium]|jgi:isopentenyldiphosphate isomerase